jgi:Winged helix-turn-helix DNA-binding
MTERKAVSSDRIRELHAAGRLNMVEIAAEVGISRQRVWQILKQSAGMCPTHGIRLVDDECDRCPPGKWKPGGPGTMPKKTRGPTTFSGCFKW